MSRYEIVDTNKPMSLQYEQPIETNEEVQGPERPIGQKPTFRESIQPYIHAAKPVIRPIAKALAGVAALPATVGQIGVELGNIIGEPTKPVTWEKLQESRPAWKYLPTLEQATEKAEELIGESLKSETPTEESIDRAVGTFVNTFLGGKMALPERILLAGGGEALRRTAKAAGRSDTSADMFSTLGEIGISAVYHTHELYKSIPKMYDETKKYLKPGEVAKAGSLAYNIDKFIAKESADMVGHADKQLVVKKAKEVRRKIKKSETGTHEIDLEGLVNSKISVNEMIAETSKGKQIFKNLSGLLNEGIGNSRLTNPEFYDAYRKADDLFAAFHGNTMLEDAIKKSKTAQKIIKNPLVRSVIGGGAFGHAAHKGLAGAATSGVLLGGVAGLYKLSDILMKNATARKTFIKATKNMRNFRIADAIHDFAKFDKQINQASRYEIEDTSQPIRL